MNQELPDLDSFELDVKQKVFHLNKENAKLKQINYALKYELDEAIKAIVRFRKEYAMPVFVREIGRKVSLDLDDPLYPWCPFRLSQEDITKFLNKEDSHGEKSQTR